MGLWEESISRGRAGERALANRSLKIVSRAQPTDFGRSAPETTEEE